MPLPAIAPSQLGFSPERLRQLHAFLQDRVEQEELVGAVTLIARDSKIADLGLYGWSDREARTPMQRDRLFRLASMTKLVTAVAVLMLWEKKRFALDDPVEKYLPLFRHTPASIAARPITIRHLLTHTSGISSFDSAARELKLHYAKLEAQDHTSLEAYVGALARIPLSHPPGEGVNYGLGYQVLGLLVQVLSSQPFDAFVQEHIFTPLRLQNIYFQVPPAEQSRLARTYSRENLVLRPKVIQGTPYYLGGAGFPRGSSGLVSTIDDFALFCQMLLNGGELNGTRLLDRATVALMTSDQLGSLTAPTSFLPSCDTYGLGVGVRRSSAIDVGAGPTGQFGWTGAYTTYCSIDAAEKTLALLFTQHTPWNENDLFGQFSRLFYATLSERRNALANKLSPDRA